MRTGSGDPKTLKGECRHRHSITYISLNHDCNCMKLTRFVSFCFGLMFKSKVVRLMFDTLGGLCCVLGRAQRTAERFCYRIVGRFVGI